jgi:hypothetical protein
MTTTQILQFEVVLVLKRVQIDTKLTPAPHERTDNRTNATKRGSHNEIW